MKPQKTKQLSVAIAEASSAGEDAFAKQQAQTNPRKRGRPRKIVEKTESEEQKEGVSQWRYFAGAIGVDKKKDKTLTATN
ncbi:hypothetical protein V6N11_021541 [Hibiscus sabdariffa]|uniref:Uncharacterized protein n=1 Tax=Hibiscus sabdariffa TaxID=183260 RepID=A0ABR2NI15_9ROSI